MDDKIQPGYSAPVEGEGAVAYETISGAVEAHNAAAQPGEPYWGISIADSTYRVYAYGAVPQPPTEEEQMESLRSRLLTDASDCCERTIRGGVDVIFADGTQEHFSLQITDQTNIDGVFGSVTLGATAAPYHADGKACRMYSAKDILTLYMTVKSFITKQTTYCNALRQWIQREESFEVLKGIHYGADLPEDLAGAMEQLLTEANEQVQNIAARMAGDNGE